MRAFPSLGFLFWLSQTCIASPPSSALKHGTIGMGITMYKPLCAYACSDTLSGLYLNCTTFEDMGHMGMEGMDMKVKKRMDMGSEPEGMTSSDCRATDTVWLQTFAYCLKVNCAADNVKESDIEDVWPVLAAGGITPPSYRSSIPTSAPTEELDSDAMWLNTTALVNHEGYWKNHQTLGEFEYQEDTHVLLSTITLAGTVGIFLLIGAFKSWKASKAGSSLPKWISKHVTLPALISRHQVPLPYNIGYAPSRATSIFIFFFVAVQIIFCSVPYKSTLPGADNAWFSNKKGEISTYVANRTGVLSFANLALAILFGTRNNPLLWATGISQTTGLIIHRWTARVSAVQAIVHSIIYTYTYFWDGGYASYAAEAAKAYYWWGIIATLALFLGTALSVLPLRLRFYETFIIVHIAMAILALVGCWYHIYLRFAHKWGYEVWLYLAIAFWSWDRIVRFGRLVYYNWIGVSTKATAELLPGDDLIKLTIVPGRGWSYGAGQHTFLAFPSLGYRPWESHPFSIVGWGSSSTSLVASSSAPSLEKPSSDNEKKYLDVTTTPISTPVTAIDANSIAFLVRPYNGVTKRLHRDLLSKPRGPQSIRVWTEGPHGHAANLKNFEHVLLIGGGIGITALLPYAQAFAWTRPDKQTMTIAYTAREQELITAAQQMLPREVEGLEFDFKVTESENMRMDIGAVIRREAAKIGTGRLAVVVCGPPGLADEVRQQAVNVVGEGKGVELFEESFCW